MQEESSGNTGQRLKSPFAGMWCLCCSVICAILLGPIGALAGCVALGFGYDDVGAWWAGLLFTFVTMIPLGLVFLVWGFIIGGKYTRWLCAFWVLLALVVFIMSLL